MYRCPEFRGRNDVQCLEAGMYRCPEFRGRNHRCPEFRGRHV